MGILPDIAADIEGDWEAALAALAWQVDLGLTDAVGDAPVDRYALPEAQPGPAVAAPAGLPAGAGPAAPQPAPPPAQPATPPAAAADHDAALSLAVEAAQRAASRAADLAALRAAIEGYEHCELRRGARNTVFADGLPGARVLILGEAPGRDEDLEGRPFVGRAGQLLDRMFAAIGLSRQAPLPREALYITNVMPWRPPGNRDPDPAEIAMMRPFVERHIALAAPEVIVVMGNTSLLALTGQKGVLRARGRWTQALGLPLLPMTHPAYLLRNPIAKRDAWADLLTLRERLGA